MKKFWDERYAAKEYVYGTEPSVFLKNVLAEFQLQGKILLPGEGEGRNAVYAAKMGLEVMAFDQSIEGQKKAFKLAKSNNVTITYLLGGMEEVKFTENSFDAIALSFVHFPSQLRSSYHLQLARLLKKGGLMILEGFSKKQFEFFQLNPKAGGPKNIDLLYSQEEIKNDFPQFTILKIKDRVLELEEGTYHQGASAVIRFIGRKNS